MKRMYCAAAAGLMMVVLSGCNNEGKSTEKGTGPYVDSNKNPLRELKVSCPDVTVQQDKTHEFTVSITRTHIEGPVVIALPDLPAGVVVDTKDMTIPADQKSLAVTIKATPQAKVVEKQKVKVTATAKDIAPANTNIELTVKAK